MKMIDARIYSRNNSVQRDDAEYTITNYLQFMNWGRSENILDVGTGDGYVLFEILLPKLPKCLRKIVLLDISENMLEIARTRSGDNYSKTECVLFDIGSPVLLPIQLHFNFDHIFSFYCLHWVREQRQALQNLFYMLKPGGDILLTIVGNHVVFDIYGKMAKLDNWSHLKSDFLKYISPYHHSPNADKEIEIYLKDVGFVDYKCVVVNRFHTYGSFMEFYDWTLGVNHFIKRVPEEEQIRYKEDFLSFAKNLLILGEDGKSPPYEWGDIEIQYSPKTDIALLNKTNDLDKFIRMPPSKFSMLDAGRLQEIDDFYMGCQLHRDQYKDLMGRLHPLDYFKTTDFCYQCAPDPTSKYIQSPQFYVKYKSPQVLPLSLERSYKSPLLPERALTGRYDPVSDIKYKR